MSKRKTVDADLIMRLDPCIRWPEKRVRDAVPRPVSVEAFLTDSAIPINDRMWVVMHVEFMTKTVMIRFVCDCIEHALKAGIVPKRIEKEVLASLKPLREGAVVRRKYIRPITHSGYSALRRVLRHLTVMRTPKRDVNNVDHDAYAYAVVLNCQDVSQKVTSERRWQLSCLKEVMDV